MQGDWFGPLIAAALVVAALVFFVAVLRKARQRRRAEFSEDDGTTAALDVSTARDGTNHAREAEAVDVGAEPEPEGAVEEESEEDHQPELSQEGTGGPEAPVEKEEASAGVVGVAQPTSEEGSADAALTQGLAKTRASLWGRLSEILRRQPQVDPTVLNDLEEALLTADVGVSLTTRLLAQARDDLKRGSVVTPAAVRAGLKTRLAEALRAAGPSDDPFAGIGLRPRVILFVGVNGVGKTTTIGKVAAYLRGRGQRVLLAAGDTFRAAAVEQLGVWAERTQSELYHGDPGQDPASVIFNAINRAATEGIDVVLADTAGRLHTKTGLMDEIKKVKRAVAKAREHAPDHTWLVVDATTGQNALQQAREFHQALGLTGVILTKLDGTAKGGVVVAIADALKLPVRFVGVGEKPDDLRPFVADVFVSALFAAPGVGGVS